MFESIDGEHFRRVTRYLQARIEERGQRLKSELPFELPVREIERLLAEVLPPDDSAFQFSSAGGGLTSDPEKTLDELYQRYVERYTLRGITPSRGDEDVWKVYKEPLDKRHVIQYLRPKRIVAPNYNYEFEHARRNKLWHAYEPVSLDLVEASSIVDRANNWLGRMMSLAESDEKFELHVLLGKPQEPKLQSAYIKAQNILHKMPTKHELVQESEAEQFAEFLKREIEQHGG